MGQFDNFKSIALLFTGAFLVSFGVIAFLNIEIQSRSNHGVKIRNENLFEVFGKKISQMISTLRKRNSYRRSVLYHLFIQESTTRSPLRKLQYFNEDTITVNDVAEHYFNRTHRHLRHVKKIKRLTELLFKERNKSDSREMKSGLEKKYEPDENTFISDFNNMINNRTIAFSATIKPSSEEGLKVHQNCYTSNDVLEIIAITCLVNFVFWFMIIICVNIFTRNQKMMDSFESLTSVGSGSEYELSQNYPKKKERDFLTVDQQNLIADYVNSLPTGIEEENPENESAEPSAWSQLKPKVTRNNSEIKINSEKWIHQKFIHLSNIFFDTVSLDDLKPVKKKNFVSRNKNNKIVNSFSMEDLIF